MPTGFKSSSFHNIHRRQGYNEAGPGRYDPNLVAALVPYSAFEAERSQPRNVGYVQFGGVTGDIATTPNKASYAITGKQLEVVMRVKCPAQNGAYQTVIAQSAGATTTNTHFQIRWHFSVTGHMEFAVSNGAAVTTVNSGTFFSQDVWYWIRVRYLNTTGAWSFEWAADQETKPTSWTARTSGTMAVITPSTDTTPLSIGGLSGGGHPYSGQIKRVILTVATVDEVDFDASLLYGDGGVGSLGNVWTIAIPKLVDISGNNRGTITFGSGTNQPKYLPYKQSSYAYSPGTASNIVGTLTQPLAATTTDTLEFVHRYSDVVLSGAYSCLGTYRSGAGQGLLMYATSTAVRMFAGDGSVSIDSGDKSAVLSSSGWVRCTLVPGTGMLKTFTAPYSLEEPTSWTEVATYTGATLAGWAAATYVCRPSISYLGTFPANVKSHRFITKTTGTVTSDFDAAKCGQNGYTDYIGNAWTVNRATSGAKLEVLSPAAHSDRAAIQFATDDYATVSNSAVVASEPELWVIIFRHHTTTVATSVLLSNYVNATTKGVTPYFSSGGLGALYIQDAAGVGASISDTVVNSIRTVMYCGRESLTDRRLQINNRPIAVSATAVGTTAGGTGYRIGADLAGSFADVVFESLLIFNRGLTSTEIESVVAAHRGGF